MIQDIFSPLFDLQDNRLKRLGNPLLELDQQIDWNKFRPLLNKIHEKVRKSKAGAKPKDEVMMFKGLVLQNLYGLSDDQLEYQMGLLCNLPLTKIKKNITNIHTKSVFIIFILD